MNNTKLVFVFLLLFVGCFLLFSNKLLTGVTTKVENTITLEKKEEPTRLNTETDLKTTTTTTTTTSTTTTTTTTTPTTTTSTTTENVIVEKQTELSLIKSISTTPQAEKKPTWILMWRPPWGLTTEGRNEGFKAGDCILTYNRSRIEEAAAVVFHYSGLDKDTMPWQHYRGREQFYVFFSMEAPSYVKHGENRAMDKFDNGFINWTMTYRSDSDVFCPYFESKYAREVFARDEAWLNTTLAKKSRVALWVVSNCELLRGSRLRMDYVTKMVEAGFPVDRFGHCFKNKEEFSSLSEKQLQSYKFYLSFENAEHCKDYATEKFWRNGIQYGRVPVVWGPSKKDIEYLAPPGSYIHTEDFESPAKLVEYLLYLDKNDTAYREYFNWVRNPGEGMERIKKLYSRTREEVLCDKLLSNPTENIHSSMTDFFYNSEPTECLA